MSLSNRRLCEWILLLSLTVGVTHPFQDPDGWWHLGTGQHILETGTIPHEDPFSATRTGRDWVAHEWLTEVFMYSLYRVGGLGFLSLVFSLIGVATFWIAYLRCPARPYVAALATVLGTAAAFPFLGPRPQVLSFLLVSATLGLLDAHRARGRPIYAWALVPMMALWANLHAAFAVGLGLIALRILGLALETGFRPDTVWGGGELSRLAKVWVACLLVVPLNPRGVRLYWYPVETVLRQTERIYLEDWASPDFQAPVFYFFALLMLVTLALFATAKTRPRVDQMLLLVATLYLALQAGRNVPIFALAAIPLVTGWAADLLGPHPWSARLIAPGPHEPPPRRANAAIAAVMLVLTVGAVHDRASAFGEQEASRFPSRAVEFLKEQGVTGTVFNVYEWGGYLIWNLYPRARPYIDGRPEIYGDAYVAEFAACYLRGSNCSQVLSGGDVRTVLIRPEVALASLLRTQPDWKNVFEDEVAVVFVRTD